MHDAIGKCYSETCLHFSYSNINWEARSATWLWAGFRSDPIPTVLNQCCNWHSPKAVANIPLGVLLLETVAEEVVNSGERETGCWGAKVQRLKLHCMHAYTSYSRHTIIQKGNSRFV